MNKKRYMRPETELLTLAKGPVLMAASGNNPSLDPTHEDQIHDQESGGDSKGPGMGGDTTIPGGGSGPGSETDPLEAKRFIWE